MIHATALVDPAAKIGADVSIGAYSIVGPDVEIGEGTTIGPHVVIEGATRIGHDNRIFQFASLGAEPQDKKFHGERSELVIGDRNVIREFVTFNRGTTDGGGATRIGDDNWIMAYVHIAHDCQVGNQVVFANNATLAGHVEIGDFVILGGFTGIHQFCKIGAHAFTGMGSLDQCRRATVRHRGRRLCETTRHQQRGPEAARLRCSADQRDQTRLPHPLRRRHAARGSAQQTRRTSRGQRRCRRVARFHRAQRAFAGAVRDEG